jgi:hypothetical protein
MISNGAVISAYALDWILMVIFPENAMTVGGVIHHQAGLVKNGQVNLNKDCQIIS